TGVPRRHLMTPATRASSLLTTDLDRAVDALRGGGLVAMPTETVYGLAVLPQPAALQALMVAKQRSPEKGIPLLIDGLSQVEELVMVVPAARRLALSLWPGPLTLVLPLRQGQSLPTLLTGGRDTLALRVPDHAVPRALARSLGPIATTSANRSGEDAARTASELVDAVGASLALVLDDGPVGLGVASTVVAVAGDGSARILRLGALPRSEIEALVAESR
ncbi:MAG: L-threonylcarbamoyladenylate synthase, partial [Chloroflexota bacterium]